jgi:hypothetical protein
MSPLSYSKTFVFDGFQSLEIALCDEKANKVCVSQVQLYSGSSMLTSNSVTTNQTYQYTNDWFVRVAKGVWDFLIPQISPVRILEIGSYEGASTCYLIEKLATLKEIELHCVDTWEGGVEHKNDQVNMSDVEKRFHHNTKIAIGKSSKHVSLVVHKGLSELALSRLIAQGKQGYFDFIYIDGSHQAPDVLCDAVLSFRLLKKWRDSF